MRIFALLFLLVPLQAQAWTFTPGLICRLSHETSTAQVELTFDPAKPLYSVTITRDQIPNGPVFSMVFEGPKSQTISTNRHTLSADGTQVTVTDTGFGNVLDGLQFNEKATASIGGLDTVFSLEGAAAPTALFRKCETAAGV